MWAHVECGHESSVIQTVIATASGTYARFRHEAITVLGNKIAPEYPSKG